MRNRRPRRAELLIVLALLVVACTDGEEGPTATPTALATVVPTESIQPVLPLLPTEPPEAVVEPADPPAAREAEPEAEPKEEPEEEPEEETVSEAEADIGLTLLGVVRGSSGAPSALIESDGQQEIFRKGDPVFDRGTLQEVRGDSVLIRSGRRDVLLRLPTAAAEAPPPPAAAEVVDARPPLAADAPPPVERPIRREEARAAFRDFRRVLREADAESVQVSGGRGVQLGEVRPASFLADLGLKSGDILQKIGRTAIEDPEKPLELGGAAEGSEVTLTFVREGIGLTLSRPVR